MPTYQYRCTECGHDLEAVQKFSDAALTECPSCHGQLRKVYNAVGVVFKGSGFYRTDSRKPEGSSSSSGSSGGSESKGSSGGSEGKGSSSGSEGTGSSGSGSSTSGGKTESAKTPAKAGASSSTGSSSAS